MGIIYSESGWESSLSFEQACDMLEKDGYLSPRDIGHKEEEVNWLGADYARNELLEIGERWDTDAPYWYVPVYQYSYLQK